MNTPPMPGSPSRATLQSTTGRIAAVGTALLLVLFLVLSVSRAALVADTSNPGNSAETEGVVTLTDDDFNQALFTSGSLLQPLVGLLPADLATAIDATAQCIAVRYDGDFSSEPIMMYATGVLPAAFDDLGALAPYLDITIKMQEVTPDIPLVQNPAHLCTTVYDVADLADAGDPELIFTGTLDDFGHVFADGLETFPGTQGTYAFKITMHVQDNPAAAQKTADWNFVWEAQTL